jgi:hypothetical protein
MDFKQFRTAKKECPENASWLFKPSIFMMLAKDACGCISPLTFQQFIIRAGISKVISSEFT